MTSIKHYGENFVQFKPKRFGELVRWLHVIDGFLMGADSRVHGADYWGICHNSPEENTVVRLSQGLEGEQLAVNWDDVADLFPEFVDLCDAFGLHYYVGKNSVGNWGIHRHVYDTTSTMNLCILVSGNNGGTVNFHHIPQQTEKQFQGMSDHNILEIIENPTKRFLQDTIMESVQIKDGEIYSFNTGVWHSHLVQQERAELFLMHFQDAVCVQDIY